MVADDILPDRARTLGTLVGMLTLALAAEYQSCTGELHSGGTKALSLPQITASGRL